jgi:hypothetical protein
MFCYFYFAIANIFAYYFLSINEYIPVVVSALIGLTQIVLMYYFITPATSVRNAANVNGSIIVFQLLFFFITIKKIVLTNKPLIEKQLNKI